MEIRSRVFEKYIDYQFKIPLKNGDKVLVKEGKVEVGDILFERSDSSLKKSLSITKALGCKKEECENYLTRIEGEYIQEGEIIAKRVSSGKLSVTTLVSPVSGVLDFSRVKQGYVDILGEENSSTIKSDFVGCVNTVDPIDGLVITTNAVAIDGVVSSKSEDKFFGKLEILEDGNTILKEGTLNDDYRGKIVWVGPYLYNRVAIELFEKGAVAVLTYAMSYTEFREIGLPIMILGGFGSVHCDAVFLKKLLTFRNKFVMLDTYQNQLFILSDSDLKNREWFVKQYINQSVISRSQLTYGYIGKILDYDQDSNNVLVDFGKKGTSLMNIGLIDFIDL